MDSNASASDLSADVIVNDSTDKDSEELHECYTFLISLASMQIKWKTTPWLHASNGSHCHEPDTGATRGTESEVGRLRLLLNLLVNYCLKARSYF